MAKKSTLTRRQLADTFVDPTELFAVVRLLQARRALQEKVAAMEVWLAEDTRRRPDLIALRTVPGIGAVLGLTIVLESGEIGRFDEVGQYTSYCRLVPALRFSNGKKKGTGNRKCGNRYLAWAWIEAANVAIRFEPVTTARRPSPEGVALEAATLGRPCLWTARRITERVLGAKPRGRRCLEPKHCGSRWVGQGDSGSPATGGICLCLWKV